MDSLIAWNQLQHKSNHGIELISYNNLIKINNKTVFNPSFVQTVLWISQDLYFNRIVIPFNVWVQKGAMPNDFLTWICQFYET